MDRNHNLEAAVNCFKLFANPYSDATMHLGGRGGLISFFEYIDATKFVHGCIATLGVCAADATDPYIEL